MNAMEHMTTMQVAEKWGISDRRVCVLCQQRHIEGTYKEVRSNLLPVNAVKPTDGAIKMPLVLFRGSILRWSQSSMGKNDGLVLAVR